MIVLLQYYLDIVVGSKRRLLRSEACAFDRLHRDAATMRSVAPVGPPQGAGEAAALRTAAAICCHTRVRLEPRQVRAWPRARARGMNPSLYIRLSLLGWEGPFT